jgi:hypothetical protein
VGAPFARARLHDHRIAGMPVATADAADVRRREVRNLLIHRRLTATATAHELTTAPVITAPPPRAGFVWVPASGGIPGHWERERAGGTQPVPDPPAPKGYKIAALKCRLLPRTP